MWTLNYKIFANLDAVYPVCGNGVCDDVETEKNCPGDCKKV